MSIGMNSNNSSSNSNNKEKTDKAQPSNIFSDWSILCIRSNAHIQDECSSNHAILAISTSSICYIELQGLLPVFGDVERPLKLEMSFVIVINESRDCIVVTPGHHSRRSFLRSELLDVFWLVGGVRRITANHLLVLAKWDALSLELLDILEAREDLLLDDELGLHLILATFFDSERFLLERFEGPSSGEIDCDIGSAFNLEGERLDDAEAGVIGIRNGVA